MNRYIEFEWKSYVVDKNIRDTFKYFSKMFETYGIPGVTDDKAMDPKERMRLKAAGGAEEEA